MDTTNTENIDLKIINGIIEKYKPKGSRALIAILQTAQDAYGYLPEVVLNEISYALKIPLAKVYGVCTFYTQFRLQPQGKYVIRVCDGTACHVRGSDDILKEIQSNLGITAGDTTDDGLFSLETVACIGACGLAPVMMIGDETFGKLTPKKISQIIDEYRNKQ